MCKQSQVLIALLFLRLEGAQHCAAWTDWQGHEAACAQTDAHADDQGVLVQLNAVFAQSKSSRTEMHMSELLSMLVAWLRAPQPSETRCAPCLHQHDICFYQGLYHGDGPGCLCNGVGPDLSFKRFLLLHEICG